MLSVAERLLRCLPESLRSPDESSSVPWASITFSGARHVFRYRGQPPPGLAAVLDAIEFALPSQLVADIAIVSEPGGFRIEVLTIESA